MGSIGDGARVHVGSPLGRALPGAVEGEEIEIAIGAAPMRLRVLDLTILADGHPTAGAQRQGARR